MYLSLREVSSKEVIEEHSALVLALHDTIIGTFGKLADGFELYIKPLI